MKSAKLDWSGLLTDLLAEIAERLNLIEDFTAFRGVCTSWRAAAATKDKLSKVPLLMLPENDVDCGDNVPEFYSLCKGKTFTRMPMPETKGKRCIGAGFGWFLSFTELDQELNLVKLMTSSSPCPKIKLPKIPNPDVNPTRTPRAVLSANPSETSDFVLVLSASPNVSLWRKGDKNWTKLELQKPLYGFFANMCLYKQKMYGIDWMGAVWTWDPRNATQEIAERFFIIPWDYSYTKFYANYPVYLVESSMGDLLVIFWIFEREKLTFVISLIDTVKREFNVINSLPEGDAVSVAAGDFPGVVKPNCIYFTLDSAYFIGLQMTDMGIYSVEDGSIEWFNAGDSSSKSNFPPFWIFPSF